MCAIYNNNNNNIGVLAFPLEQMFLTRNFLVIILFGHYHLLVNLRELVEVEHFMNKISRKPSSHALLSRVAQDSWIKLSKKAVTATKRNERKEDREEK